MRCKHDVHHFSECPVCTPQPKTCADSNEEILQRIDKAEKLNLPHVGLKSQPADKLLGYFHDIVRADNERLNKELAAAKAELAQANGKLIGATFAISTLNEDQKELLKASPSAKMALQIGALKDKLDSNVQCPCCGESYSFAAASSAYKSDVEKEREKLTSENAKLRDSFKSIVRKIGTFETERSLTTAMLQLEHVKAIARKALSENGGEGE